KAFGKITTMFTTGALKLPIDGDALRQYAQEAVIAWDWLYPGLTAAQRQQFISWLNGLYDHYVHGQDSGSSPERLGDSDQTLTEYFFLAFMDLATGPDNPRAGTFLSGVDVGGTPIGG